MFFVFTKSLWFKISDYRILHTLHTHMQSEMCQLILQNVTFHLFSLLISGGCEAGWPTSCSSTPGILTQPHFTASIILSPVTNLSKVDSIPKLLPFLSLFLRLHLSYIYIKTHYFLQSSFSVHLLTLSLCPFRSPAHFLSFSRIFFLTLTATRPHLEIHQRRKAGGMKSAAVIYELLWSRRSPVCIGDGGHVCVN